MDSQNEKHPSVTAAAMMMLPPTRGMVLPKRAAASHTRWSWLFGTAGPFRAYNLCMSPAQRDDVIGQTWNAGRHPPHVTLTVEFDGPVRLLRLCPHMSPESGHVGLVIAVLSEEEGAVVERVPHSALWREGEWVSIALPRAASAFRIEFMESPSWIALHAVEGEPAPK